MKTPMKRTKAVAKIVVGFSTSFTVARALRNTVNPQSPIQAALLVIGSVAIGSVVAAKTEDWICDTIDELHDAATELKITLIP